MTLLREQNWSDINKNFERKNKIEPIEFIDIEEEHLLFIHQRLNVPQLHLSVRVNMRLKR